MCIYQLNQQINKKNISRINRKDFKKQNKTKNSGIFYNLLDQYRAWKLPYDLLSLNIELNGIKFKFRMIITFARVRANYLQPHSATFISSYRYLIVMRPFSWYMTVMGSSWIGTQHAMLAFLGSLMFISVWMRACFDGDDSSVSGW